MTNQNKQPGPLWELDGHGHEQPKVSLAYETVILSIFLQQKMF